MVPGSKIFRKSRAGGKAEPSGCHVDELTRSFTPDGQTPQVCVYDEHRTERISLKRIHELCSREILRRFIVARRVVAFLSGRALLTLSVWEENGSLE